LPFVEGKQVLDVPCGNGRGTSMLSGAASLTGLDASAEAIRDASSRFSGIDFRVARMEALPLESNCFDVVVCLDGIESLYLSDAALFLAQARRVLRPEGRIIVTTPLLQGGPRHSGNPDHCYEFTEASLRGLLEQYFETVSLEIFESGQGTEARYVGQPAKQPADRQPDHIDLCGQAKAWLEGMQTADGFRLAAATPRTLFSRCVAILLKEGLDWPSGPEPAGSPAATISVAPFLESRGSEAAAVQSCQDPSTGLFLDPLLEQFPIGNEQGEREYFEALLTYFAIQALDALGAAALHPLHFLSQFEAPGAIAAWLDGLNWSDPERESNRVMFVMAGLIHRAEKEGHAAAPALYHQVLDWLDRAQDAKTGLWGTQQGAALPGAIAAAYRFLSLYEFVYRPVCSLTRIIDAALSLPREEARSGAGSDGGAYEDLAVVELLATFTKQFKYRASDIKKRLIRDFWSVRNLQNADGGFPYAARLDAATYRFGDWTPLEVDLREGDVWATWLRVLSLQTVRSTYPEDLPEIGGWRFRRWPAVGFHRAGVSLDGLEKERLSVWLRPLSLPLDAISDAAEAPDVSVVITCYNLGRYLYEAVDSVLRQTLQSFEIILVDDGSTDEFTIRYLDIFSAPKTQVVRTANQGLSAARNAGIQLARGRYICCLDADDRLKPAFLEKAGRILDDAADIGFVSCYYETFDNDHAVYRYDGCRFPELLVQNEVVVVSVFRKEAWRKTGGYYTGLKAMEDWDFWIGILEQGYRGTVIPDILFEYRARVGSMYSVARRPENYSVTAGQIVERHQQSYRTHYLDVLRLKTSQFAELLAVRQQELEESAREKNWLEEQIRNWKRAEAQHQQAVAAYEAGKAWLEDQIRSWKRAEAQHQQAMAAYEAGKVWLEEQVQRWESVSQAQQQQISELESRKSFGKTPLERWPQSSKESGRPPKQVENSTAMPDGVSRRPLRSWRNFLLLASPRLARSNAKNLSLALKLIFGAAEGPTTWSAHFDAGYYTSTYPDIARSGVAPWLHYLLCGYLEDRNPSTAFDSVYYYSRHPDVREAGINPLLHYALFGHKEQRIAASPRGFSTDFVAQPATAAVLPHGHLFERSESSSLEDHQKPLITVVIPCFNYGQYVEQAIQSVLSQTFTNLEIIVVEGGSTDGTTPEVLRSLERRGLPKTRFVYRAESHLAGDNRNFGIGLARSPYVCCLDADDLIKPVYLEVAVFLAEFCGYDMAYPSVRCFEESDIEWLLCDPVWPEIAEANQISTVAMFRKAAWERCGGFRDWGKRDEHVPEDWEFWVRLVGHGFFAKSIREPLMLYRVHAGGLWSTRGLPVEHERQAIREANPQLFASDFVPASASLDRPAIPWDRLTEPAGPVEAYPPILFALPLIINGGAEKVFATLARALIQRGHKVVVITTLVPAPTIPDCTESFEAVTPHLFSFPRLLLNQEDRWRDFFYFLLKRHRIGTILIAGCDFVYQLLPEIATKFPHIAILDQLFNDGVHFHSNRHFAEYIDTTFVPSQELAGKLISEAGEQAAKVCIIPHGIDFEEMVAPQAAFDSSGLPQHFRGKFLVSFFGRLSVEKAPADFVEIARLLRSHEEICFLMTGEGQERAAVLALIQRHGMEARIHTPGFVDNIHELMALSDVIVVPSHLDGMPLVVFEAQAGGKAVVASAVGSIPHVIADGKTGFLCAPGDVKGFAERILKLWRSPELRRSIGEAASVWVRANHSAESMSAKYIERFDGTLK
jgi:glycosyltransferase involved in cell wall biosynthesis/SAM-dependent methyltransferase